MEIREIERRVVDSWELVKMQDLVHGDEFRYAGEVESFIVSGEPFLNEAMIWTVEVEDNDE